MSNTDVIGQALNLPPLELPKKQLVVTESDDRLADLENDFDTARSSMQEVINSGVQAIDIISRLAEQSQSARAYEVLAKVMDSVVNANQKLIEMHKQFNDISPTSGAKSVPSNVTNNLFVGSTAEFQKMIENVKNGTTAK